MTWVFIFRLVVAGLLGTVVGIEREWRVKEAGFRTHFLVSLGSALFMIVSQWGFEEFLAYHDGLRLDPSRVAAQVVSGIGFIGAGAIIFHRQICLLYTSSYRPPSCIRRSSVRPCGP